MAKRDLLWMLLLPAICSPLIHYRMEQKVQEDYKACQLNLKNLATACDMYCTDNAGRYPLSLHQLSPGHLRDASLTSMPICPGADSTFSGYQLRSAIKPDVFTICCSGFNHRPKITAADYPQYCNISGIYER